MAAVDRSRHMMRPTSSDPAGGPTRTTVGWPSLLKESRGPGAGN
jgi:hypothetical protein